MVQGRKPDVKRRRRPLMLRAPKAEAWRDVRAYETDTRKKSIEQPPGTTDLLATYHGIVRQRILGYGGAHLLLSVQVKQKGTATGFVSWPNSP
jgi:hypothetical protein